MKRQTVIHKEDKTKIKCILLQFLQDLFFAPHGDLSDDEEDESMNEQGKFRPIVTNGSSEIPGNDVYNLIFVNNTWYTLFRLHQVRVNGRCNVWRKASSK